MRIFLDTADVDEIRRAAALGIVDGVTTNPTLVARTGRDRDEVIREIATIVDGPISAEVIATETEAMVAEGKELAAIHPNIVVKVPITRAGLAATKALAEDGIRVNVTLIFQPLQGLLAAKAGAAFVSPFLGRLDDVGTPGIALIEQLRTIFDNYDYPTEILAASLRHPQHVLDVALAGADCATLPPKVLDALLNHPLTEIGLERFLADYRKATATP